jgi:hypothetical protein
LPFQGICQAFSRDFYRLLLRVEQEEHWISKVFPLAKTPNIKSEPPALDHMKTMMWFFGTP